MIKSLAYIHNANEDKLSDASEWVVEHDLWKKRRKDMIERLVEHHDKGAKVYIASCVVEPFVKHFANRINAKAIGTPIEIVNGRVRMVDELASNERKIEQVLGRLGVKRLDVAYGDTAFDIPLLEHADRPVAVYPDPQLKEAALKRGWEIIGSDSCTPQE